MHEGKPRLALRRGLRLAWWSLLLLLAVTAALLLLEILLRKDYRVLARISEAHAYARIHGDAVADFYRREQRCPRNDDTGFGPPEGYATPYIASLRLESSADGCVMHVALRNLGYRGRDDAELRMSLSAQLVWTERVNVPDSELPRGLRSNAVPRPAREHLKRAESGGSRAASAEGGQQRSDGRGKDEHDQGQ